MQIKCEYCGKFINDTDTVCPGCGAPNEHLRRGKAGTPKTIEELKAFAVSKNLPLGKMRFFIGQNYKGARAFGIYQDTDGQFVVYKNKTDGSRAVRYRGTDEAYAVNELYEKMRAEVANQRAYQAGKRQSGGTKVSGWKRFWQGSRKLLIYLLIILMIGSVNACISRHTPNRGYYLYNNDYYYYQRSAWYVYDAVDGWTRTSADNELSKNYDDYWESSYYSSGYAIEDFEDSGYYYESSSSDDDDDWDWGGSDWDSGSTDWDSDW